jgi:hypothetical protein
LGVVLLLLGVLTWPLLFTYSGFSGDWDHHLWLMWHQSLAIQAGNFPSLFLNSSYSVLYPTYAFYGGTLYAVGGILSLALGGAPVSAYVLIYVLDFAAAFGGWYWLGRMAGLGRWPAMVPGLVFVTSAYYIVIIYVQGDWPEFTGISMISLMLAAALSVLRADRVHAGAGVALAISSILFFGSHNITIMLGLTTIALAGLATIICVPDARRQITRVGVARTVAIVVPSALVSAWYLLPAFAYQSRTEIGSNYHQALEELSGTVPLVSLAHLFTFSRTGLGLPAPYYLALSLPVLAIAWVVVGMLILPWGSRNRPWIRVLLICSGLALVIGIVMTHLGLLESLPRPYPLVEFVYRLEAYVLLALSGAILAALALARGGSRRARVWAWLAVPVCAVSLVGAIQQIRTYPNPGQDRYVTLEYYGEVETGANKDYRDASAPIIAGHGLVKAIIPPEAVRADRAVSFTTHVRPGTLLATNIGAGSYLLHITGAKAVGVDSETGDMVLRVGSADSAGTRASAPEETISVSTGHSLPIVLGRLLTFAGLAILALELLALAVREYRRHTHRSEHAAKLAAPSAN